MPITPPGYEIRSGGSKYFRMQEGKNKIRVLTPALIGFQYSTRDGKVVDRKQKFQSGDMPHRVRTFEELGAEARPHAREFWAMLVWDYVNECASILEITQKTIMTAIMNYESNEDWGDALDYDLTIIKSKEGDRTSYTVAPSPKKNFERKGKEIPQVQLENLLSGGDPFTIIETTEGQMTQEELNEIDELLKVEE